MNLRRILNDLVRVILDETERNAEFKEKVLSALSQDKGSLPTDRAATKSAPASDRPKNRRMAATLDPVELAGLAEDTLRSRLSGLTVPQLQDILSDYAMDPGALIAKSKTTNLRINRSAE